MAISPDGRLIATAYSNMLGLWDLTDQRLVAFFGYPPFLDVAFVPGTPWLVEAKRHSLVFWDVAPAGGEAVADEVGVPLNIEPGIDVMEELRETVGDSKRFALFTRDRDQPRLVRKPVREVAILEEDPQGEPAAWLKAIDVSPDGALVAAIGSARAGGRAVVAVVEAKSGRVRWSEESAGDADAAESVAFSPNSERVYVGGLGLAVYDARTGRRVEHYDPEQRFGELAVSTDGQKLAAVTAAAGDELSSKVARAYIEVRDIGGEGNVRELRGHVGAIYALLFLDGDRLVSAGADRTLQVWDTETAKNWVLPEAHSDAIRDLTPLPHGRRIASVGTDAVIRLWDRKELLQLVSGEEPEGRR